MESKIPESQSSIANIFQNAMKKTLAKMDQCYQKKFVDIKLLASSLDFNLIVNFN